MREKTELSVYSEFSTSPCYDRLDVRSTESREDDQSGTDKVNKVVTRWNWWKDHYQLLLHHSCLSPGLRIVVIPWVQWSRFHSFVFVRSIFFMLV